MGSGQRGQRAASDAQWWTEGPRVFFRRRCRGSCRNLVKGLLIHPHQLVPLLLLLLTARLSPRPFPRHHGVSITASPRRPRARILSKRPLAWSWLCQFRPPPTRLFKSPPKRFAPHHRRYPAIPSSSSSQWPVSCDHRQPHPFPLSVVGPRLIPFDLGFTIDALVFLRPPLLFRLASYCPSTLSAF